MARKKIVKLDQEVVDHLKQIDKDLSEAYRKILHAFRNEAEKQAAADMIAHYEGVIKQNNERIEKIPEEKERKKQEILDEIDRKEQQLMISLEAAEIKIKYPKLITPTYEFETTEEFTKIRMRDYEFAKLDLLRKMNDLKIQKELLDEVVNEGSKYEKEIEMLDNQNTRCGAEIERFKRVIAIQEKFELPSGESNKDSKEEPKDEN